MSADIHIQRVLGRPESMTASKGTDRRDDLCYPWLRSYRGVLGMSTGNWAGEETQQWTAGAAHIVDRPGVPRLDVTAQVGGVSVGSLYVDTSTGALLSVRATLGTSSGSLDAVVAASRLSAGYPDAWEAAPGDTRLLSVDGSGNDGEITDLYLGVIGVGGTESGGFVTSGVVQHNLAGTLTSVGLVLARNVTSAQILGASSPDALVHMTFSSDDKVRDLLISLSSPPIADNGTRIVGVGRYGVLRVEARSYA